MDAHITLMPSETKIDAEIHIHLKGYTKVRVSHLDVEKTGLGKVIRRGRGNFLEIMGVESGLEVVLRERCQIILDGEEFTVSSILIASSLLSKVVQKGALTRAWVDRKYDGIYIGFRKAELESLEKLALKEFGMKRLKKLQPQPQM